MIDPFNEPVSLTWSELATRDVEAARRFYNAVFGWTGPQGAVFAVFAS